MHGLGQHIAVQLLVFLPPDELTPFLPIDAFLRPDAEMK